MLPNVMKRTRQILNQGLIQSLNDQDIFEAVCLDIAEFTGADLVSLWFCHLDGSAIKCQCRYDAISEMFSRGQVLMKADYPRYFETMVEYNYICAPDARNHPDTKELAEDYFKPNNIHSLLDFILHEDYKPIGVVCCEHRTRMRSWSDHDKSYLRSIAALISSRFQFN